RVAVDAVRAGVAADAVHAAIRLGVARDLTLAGVGLVADDVAVVLFRGAEHVAVAAVDAAVDRAERHAVGDDTLRAAVVVAGDVTDLALAGDGAEARARADA